MLLSLDISARDSHATIVAAGEVDIGTVSQLSAAMADSIQVGTTHLVVNLNKVTYIDSSGLGALVAAHKRLRASGGTLVVRCTQPHTLRLLAVTGLTKVLTIDGGPDPTAPDPAGDPVAGSALV